MIRHASSKEVNERVAVDDNFDSVGGLFGGLLSRLVRSTSILFFTVFESSVGVIHKPRGQLVEGEGVIQMTIS